MEVIVLPAELKWIIFECANFEILFLQGRTKNLRPHQYLNLESSQMMLGLIYVVNLDWTRFLWSLQQLTK